MKIFIDPGHGGSDPGATANGLKEKDLTLAIALALRNILINEYEGVDVRMARTSDATLSLQQRTDAANAYGADYYLSIHINAGGGSGFESFIFNGSVDNKTVAAQNVIHEEVMKAIGNAPNRGKKRQNFHVLRESKMAAMLTENLFIDNLTDAVRLKSPDFLQFIARGHAIGLEKAFGLKKKQKPAPPPPSTTSPFPDVSADHWAADSIRVMKDLGLMKGLSDGLFHPTQAATRAEIAVILHRLLIAEEKTKGPAH